MSKYTAEQVRTIVKGLARGKPRNYRPMTDAEFLSRYDPEQCQHKQLIGRLDRLQETLDNLLGTFQDVPSKPDRPYQPTPPPKTTGTVEL